MIDSFMGDYRWLSNFHEAPIEYGGRTFRNSEDVTAPYFAAVAAVLKTFKVKTAAVRRAKETVR